jgi:nitrite reductase (NO-forming)
MILTIRVTGAAQGAGLAGKPGRDAVISLSARPPAGWRPFNPALPPAPAGTLHRITLVAEDKEIQIAPGVTQDMWTFNGQVPGPTLRGHVGDEFIVTLVNHSSMGHSLDFHAASQPMEAIRPKAPPRPLNLMPGEGGFAEFTVPAAGHYEMLDHHLDHAAAGAAGYLIASTR